MVGPGDPADDAGVAGPVLAGDVAGRTVASGRFAGGRTDGVVREGVPDVLRLYEAGTSADLAESNYGAVGWRGRGAPIVIATPGSPCPRPHFSGMTDKVEWLKIREVQRDGAGYWLNRWRQQRKILRTPPIAPRPVDPVDGGPCEVHIL